MEKLLKQHFNFALIWLFCGALFGFIYSLNLLGIIVESNIFEMSKIRSLHISFMLYGFIPLLLSYLPFLLIDRDVKLTNNILRYLDLYSIIWHMFIIFMLFSLLFGNSRGLAFYDFPYELNFILALAGIFYILALYKSVRLYTKRPLWIRISLYVSLIAPVLLIILMNPNIGQVEATIYGPHGDNTLGMSLALIPIYYLIIKYLSNGVFVARWNILWIVPLLFYISSVMYRFFIGELSYALEWFFQYLTLLYIPLLYRWYKDLDIPFIKKEYLLISILAFLFVDIEGNIIFIESIRWLFHRNDLVVGHAHLALGLAVLFMVFAMFREYLNRLFVRIYALAIIVMAISLSFAGYIEAYLIDIDIEPFWIGRSIAGAIILFSFSIYIKIPKRTTHIDIYNILGLLCDGFGGLFLILFADTLYPLVGFRFDGGYQYIVFAFVSITGLTHYFAYRYSLEQFTLLTAIARVIISSIFFAMYLSGQFGMEALFVAGFDISYALFYFIYFYKRKINV